MKLPNRKLPMELAMTAHGRMIYLANDMYQGGGMKAQGIYSPAETHFLRSIFKPDWICIDGGCNHGIFTVEMLKHCEHVIAIDPQPLMIDLVKMNVILNNLLNKCSIVFGALGATEYIQEVLACNYETFNNFGAYSIQREGPENAVRYKIPVTTIDKLIELCKVPRVDFIKLDVEGMELDALIGASGTIEKFKPTMFIECDKEDKSFDLMTHIESLGYDMYWVRSLMYDPDNPFNCSIEDNPFGNATNFNLYCVPCGGDGRGLIKAHPTDDVTTCKTTELCRYGLAGEYDPSKISASY